MLNSLKELLGAFNAVVEQTVVEQTVVEQGPPCAEEKVTKKRKGRKNMPAETTPAVAAEDVFVDAEDVFGEVDVSPVQTVTITRDALRDLGQMYMAKFGVAKTVGELGKFGVKKISDLPDDQLAALYGVFAAAVDGAA